MILLAYLTVVSIIFALKYKSFKSKNIEVEILADSKNGYGDRLTTFLVTYPLIILKEVLTHRTFSRNTSSSRAIPYIHNYKRVFNEPFLWKKVVKNHKGMQGSKFFGTFKSYIFNCVWWSTGITVANIMLLANKLGVSKQLCNRAIEPWLYCTQVITSSEAGLRNFYELRTASDAEYNIQDLAIKMLNLYSNNIPKQLDDDQYHLPMSNLIDRDCLIASALELDLKPSELLKRVSIARCARTSYYNFEGTINFNKDSKLCMFLAKNKHFSPLEHVAKNSGGCDTKLSGNFGAGWIQERKLIENDFKSRGK